MVHQQIDHVRRHAQVVIQPRQHLQVGGFQLAAQLLLHLGDQHPEGAVVLQKGRQVLGAVYRALLRRGRRRRLRRTLDQAQPLQARFRRIQPQLAPAQPGLKLLLGDAPVRPHQKQV